MTSTIVMGIVVVGIAILFLGQPAVKLSRCPTSPLKAGMDAAIALFGIAWLTGTFIAANDEVIVNTVGGRVSSFPIVALSAFIVAALTTSRSTATRTMVLIGIGAGLSPGIVAGMWAGAIGGCTPSATGGLQIAGANFDRSGTTRLGTTLVDYSYFIPMLVLSAPQ